MLQSFRSILKSKVGIAIALVFLGLIAFAFASADVSSTGVFGGVAGGDRVAVVGDRKIGSAELSSAASSALERVRKERDPTISMPAFLAAGGLTEVIDGLIDRAALQGYARKYGIRAGSNLVNSEIRQIPAFRGADGNFSEEAYRQTLATNRLTDKQVRDDLATGLIAQQMLLPAGYGTTLPNALATRYAQLFKERRQGAIASLPSTAYAPTNAPTDAQLSAFYNANKRMFIRPERRVIRYVAFDVAALGSAVEPTEAEIAARYKQDAARYAARETRSFTQLIVPTEAAAKALATRVAGGASFDLVAREAGLRPAKLVDVDRAAVNSQASAAVAAAFFSAPSGGIAQPARGSLGWYVARVDAVTKTPARTLAQASTTIRDALREEKKVKGLADLASQVEDQIEEGATLTEIARDLKLTPSSTKPIVADGRVYGSATEMAPPILAPALATAFQMEEEEPQLAPLAGGNQYLLFETADMVASAAAPLAQIRDDVTTAWRITEGSKAAKAAAERVLARLKAGKTLAAAIAEERRALPAVDSVNLTREDLARQGDRRIPPPVALMFSMAQGTSKRLEGANRAGWYVVDLDRIALDAIAKDDPLIAQARQELGKALGDEYGQALRRAMRDELGVERNEAAIAAVRKQLSGGN